jgi:hypothetical protein
VNEVIVPPRRRNGGNSLVITETIAPYASTFAVAQRCAEWKAALPQVRDIASARDVRTTLLPNFQSIDAAGRELADMLSQRPDHPVTEALALKLLGSLYGALGKRNSDAHDAAALLQASAEMFSESDATLAKVINVEPLPRHPVVLALGVKRLVATKVFAPAPAEVRKAVLEVRDRIRLLQFDVPPLLKMTRDAERLVFNQDRNAWALPYMSGKVPSVVAIRLVDYGDDSAEWWTAVEALPHEEESDA